jgi:hypothetical protein
MEVQGVFIVAIVFGSIAITIIKISQDRHEFKMKLLEKGLTPAEFKELFPKTKGLMQTITISPLRNLQVGILALFVGIGLLIGQAFDRMYNYETFFIPTSMLISCGVGLIVFYFISKKKLNKE